MFGLFTLAYPQSYGSPLTKPTLDRLGVSLMKKTVNALYVINIMTQAIFDLASPIGLGVLASWLLVRYADAPRYIYAILLPVGAILGLYNMIRFLLISTSALERLDSQNEKGRTGDNNEK